MFYGALQLLACFTILLLFFDVGRQGKIAILVIVAISFLLPVFAQGDSVYLMRAIGNAIRFLLAIIFLIKLKAGAVSF